MLLQPPCRGGAGGGPGHAGLLGTGDGCCVHPPHGTAVRLMCRQLGGGAGAGGRDPCAAAQPREEPVAVAHREGGRSSPAVSVVLPPATQCCQPAGDGPPLTPPLAPLLALSLAPMLTPLLTPSWTPSPASPPAPYLPVSCFPTTRRITKGRGPWALAWNPSLTGCYGMKPSF
ncbi:wiskott-Aldrich syndrome protein homolog [Canis lupus dingo]|uniref:wiskott-Aldrich syndrome protein homolog n=1 Tax=Canis lupus dingo TaxID=286419 RepID=UPI0020C4C56E|nr:wiskott-Aldrich syndrome protein homolog [Canis lupus dingo]